MKIQDAIQLKSRLQGSDSPDEDVTYLLCHLLNVSRSYLFTWPERELSAEQAAAFEQLLERRAQGEPVAYLIGQQGFWSFDLEVSPDTLIPRADTETLVEQALERLPEPRKAYRVLDLGTGTGAIALAIALERPFAQVVAVDRVAGAVELAQRNGERLQARNLRVLQSDWYSAVVEQQFDLIVSNPPYIEPNDPHLTQGDLRFEPSSALVAEDAGLADIRTIITEGWHHLIGGGYLLLEHGYQQGEAVRQIFQQQGWCEAETVADLGGNPRVTLAYKPNQPSIGESDAG